MLEKEYWKGESKTKSEPHGSAKTTDWWTGKKGPNYGPHRSSGQGGTGGGIETQLKEF